MSINAVRPVQSSRRLLAKDETILVINNNPIVEKIYLWLFNLIFFFLIITLCYI